MAIISEFQNFASEDEFVQKFIVPLIGRLGFGVVLNYHGTSEAGMDLIVGEIDRFGHVRYHGIQAKFEPSIGKSAAHGLVEDAVEAFSAEFTHPQTGAKHRISSFYVLNGGTLSDEARKLFFARLQGQYGDNVKLLEGRDLLALDRSAALRAEDIRNRLVGLELETTRILGSLERLEPRLHDIVNGDGNGVVYPIERLRLVSAEAWLSNPPLLSEFPINELENLHTFGSSFNRALDEAGSSPLHSVVSIKIPAHKALRLVLHIVEAAKAVAEAAHTQVATLGSLTVAQL